MGMNSRPVFVEKKIYKQSGVRSLLGAGALFFGIFLAVAVISWIFRELPDQPDGYGTGTALAQYLEENGVEADRTVVQNPYGRVENMRMTERWTLSGPAWDSLPESARSFLVISMRGSSAAREAAENLSPSGGKLAVRTGGLAFRTVDIGPDANRLVWQEDLQFIYYTGGDPQVEELLTGFAGPPVADGRASDPPAFFWTLATVFRMFVTWQDFAYFIVCAVAAALTVLCLAFAIRPPKPRAPGDPSAFSARMGREGVSLLAYPKGAGPGPYGELPGVSATGYWLPYKGERAFQELVRETERQALFGFPENLVAAYFFTTAHAAKQAAAQVAPAGDRLKAGGGMPLGFSYRRRVYRSGKVVAYYAGPEPAVYDALERVCGKPFAGLGVGRHTEEE